MATVMTTSAKTTKKHFIFIGRKPKKRQVLSQEEKWNKTKQSQSKQNTMRWLDSTVWIEMNTIITARSLVYTFWLFLSVLLKANDCSLPRLKQRTKNVVDHLNWSTQKDESSHYTFLPGPWRPFFFYIQSRSYSWSMSQAYITISPRVWLTHSLPHPYNIYLITIHHNLSLFYCSCM